MAINTSLLNIFVYISMVNILQPHCTVKNRILTYETSDKVVPCTVIMGGKLNKP